MQNTSGRWPILVIDDNGANVATYQRVLGTVPNCAPVCFTSPLRALAWSKINNPLLVVVDYRMAECDGLTFIERFRSFPHTGSTPVVMLTGVSDPDLRDEALRLGAADVLAKPVDRHLLFAHVKRAIAARQTT